MTGIYKIKISELPYSLGIFFNRLFEIVFIRNGFGAIITMVLIQFLMPHGTRRITRQALLTMMLGAMQVDQKYLREYRCPTCHKLLAKGNLKHKDDILEVKCRGCSTICLFKGEDAEIISKRSILLKEGKIPDTDID